MNRSPEILAIAKRRLASQQYIPRSPGCVTPSGQTLLCLGAALAVAGAEARDGRRRADKFARRLATCGTKSEIINLGARYAMSRKLLRNAIITNDALPDRTRQIAVLAKLDM
jgi:hypothetical protein